MKETISITKKSGGILGMLGLTKKMNEVLRITDRSLFYNSALGNIGEIQWGLIEFIEFGNAETSQVIKIGLKREFNIESKLSKLQQKVSEIYKKKFGADILIFPQQVDIDLKELSELLKAYLIRKID